MKQPRMCTPVSRTLTLLCCNSACVHSITVRKAVGGVQEGAAQAIHDQVLRVEQVCTRSLPLLPHGASRTEVQCFTYHVGIRLMTPY